MAFIFVNILSCFIPVALLLPAIYPMVIALDEDKNIWQKITLVVISFILSALILNAFNYFCEGVVCLWLSKRLYMG